MKFSVLAILGLAAAVYAQDDVAAPAPEADAEVADVDVNELYKGPFGFPPGITAPKKPFMPKFGPPKDIKKGKGGLPIWHPPHKGVFIDDCEDDKADKWHWAHKGGDKKHHPHMPMKPDHKWTTSTVTATKTKTVIDCPDKHPECPGKPKTKFTTTTIEVTTTICPVPIETPKPHHPPKPTKPAPPMPPKPTVPPPSYPPKPTAPPTAPEVPEYSKPPVVVTGAAPQNAAAGALAAVAAFVAALV